MCACSMFEFFCPRMCLCVYVFRVCVCVFAWSSLCVRSRPCMVVCRGVQRVDIVIGVEITVILGVHINKVEFTLPLADKLLKLDFWGFTRVIVGFEFEFLFWL